MPYLFVRYLINRKSGEYNPTAFFRAAYGVSAADKTAGTYLQVVMGENVGFADLVTDFYTAIVADESSGRYGFEGDAVVQSTLNDYPYYVGGSGSEVSLEPTAAILLHLGQGGSFTVPSNGGSHTRYRIIGEKNSTLNPGTGSGTAEDPYQITTVKEWNQIANRPGGHYRLMNDLTFTGNAVTMIGTFSGELDGNGHTIKGVTHPICSVNAGKIQNLNVQANVTGVASNSYGVITQMNQGLIDHCTVTGTMKTILYGQYTSVGTHTGVIAGENEEAGTIQYCTVTAVTELTASALQSRNGGIAGSNRGIIANCFFKGSLKVNQPDESATVYTGGIAGETGVNGGIGGSIKQCLNAGEIIVTGGVAQTGQICGNKLHAYLTNCYGKNNTLPLFGTEKEDAQQTTSKKLTDEEWKNGDSFTGLDFNSGWQMGTDGPEMTGADSIFSLEVTGQPTCCYVGEELYRWGSLKVNNSNYIQITSDMIAQFDSSKSGNSQVVVRYRGRTLTYSIKVKEPVTVASLQLSGKPKKTAYVEGEKFDPNGILMLAKIDGEEQMRYIRSGFQCRPETLKTSDTSVTITYYGQTISIPVTVSAKIPKKLEIYEEQNRRYTAGTRLDLSEVKVRITYSNGEKSTWITETEFDQYQIHLAKKAVDSQSFISVEKTQTLSSSDNGSVYYLYAGSVLPDKYNAVSCRLGTVTIQAPLPIDGQSSNVGQEPGNGAGNSNAKVNGNDAAIPAIVKLNATSLPLQVKKSTTALKIKEYTAGDAVANWSSSNKKVAVVNARTGKITARKTGKTTITVTMQSGATAKCLIKVQKGRVKTKKLNVGKTAITLKKGEKYRIIWERLPLTSSEKATFQSSKKKIAAVSGKGIITAKKKGTTYITVKSGSKKRKIKVTVR